MSPNGAVRAIVGGRSIRASGRFNRATQALRQTGSAFKPFVYAAALGMGFRVTDTVVDRSISINVRGSKSWTPKNYDGQYLGEITLAEAFAQSVNTVAVALSETAGRSKVKEIAKVLGIKRKLATGPALALGASESTLLEMTAAYAGILNGGASVAPIGFVDLRVKGEAAPLFGQPVKKSNRAMSESVAESLIYLMHRVVKDGTGRRADLGERQAAGKTGTTQNSRDAWFIGFTADYVAGVWMGYDDNTPLRGVTGGGLPAEIWQETMKRVHNGIPYKPLPMISPKSGQSIVRASKPSRVNN